MKIGLWKDKTMRWIPAFFFSVIFIIGLFYNVHAETDNRVVAYVNDDIITLYELNKKMEEMTGLTCDAMKARNEEMYLETRREILDFLINERITQKKIQELGIEVTQDQIDQAIEDIKRSNRLTQEDLIEGLKREGISYEKYRENIKNQLQRARLINYEVKSKIIIREEQILEYYQEHLKDYSREESIHIASIFFMRKNPNDDKESEELMKSGEAALARLRNGEDFGKVARELSEGPGAQDGGDLGSFKTSNIDQGLLKVIEALPDGGVSDLIKRYNGIQIIKLIKREKAGIRPFAEVKEAIYRKLYEEEVNRRYGLWLKDLREKTFTKIIF